MIEGNTLRIEVLVRATDPVTDAIVRRPPPPQGSELFVRIPLSALFKDTDKDGIPDIREERLLLDPRHRDTDRDGVVDGLDMMPDVRDSPRPLIDGPFRRALEETLGASQEATPEPDFMDPIFVEADPSMFVGFLPRRPMLIYTPRDIAQRRSVNPDFTPIRIQSTMNRAGDRGFGGFGDPIIIRHR